MPELARNIAARLRHLWRDRRRAQRHSVKLPVEVSLVPEGHNKGFRRTQSIEGHTLDISSTGLALIVPVIRIGDHYLAGENRGLHLKLETPGGPLEIQATPVRYERLDEDESEMVYLIGVSITAMSEADRARYDQYLASLMRK